jgi:hypothetical protein
VTLVALPPSPPPKGGGKGGKTSNEGLPLLSPPLRGGMVGDTTPGVSPLRPLSGLSEFPIVERLTRAQVVSECSKSVSGMPQCVLATTPC